MQKNCGRQRAEDAARGLFTAFNRCVISSRSKGHDDRRTNETLEEATSTPKQETSSILSVVLRPFQPQNAKRNEDVLSFVKIPVSSPRLRDLNFCASTWRLHSIGAF